MKLIWSFSAQRDLDRLHDFLARHDLDVADVALDRIIEGAATLRNFPRRGQRLSEFQAHAVFEFRVSRYLVRYEIANDAIHVLRCFHAKEDRP